MAMQTIEELFEHELKDIYGAEQSLLDALEQMADESTDREIKKATCSTARKRRARSSGSRDLQELGQKPEAETCAGIEGLIKEKKLFMREKPTDELLEFYNIGAAQKVERYEITAYETLIDMAEKLGMSRRRRAARADTAGRGNGANKLKAIASEFEVEEVETEEEEETTSSRR